MKLGRITREQAVGLLDDELMGRISERGSGEFDPAHTFLGILVNGAPIGFWVVHKTSSSTLHIHIQIQYRHRAHAMDAGWLFAEYIFGGYPEIMRLECEVPHCYPDVIKYILKFNFKSEGVKRKAIYRDGELQDVQMLSLLRSEYNGRS